MDGPDVTQYGIGKTFFNFPEPLLGEFFHFLAFSEVHASGGAGEDACGKHAFLHAVVAEVALVDLFGLRVPARDVVGAGFAHGLTVDLGPVSNHKFRPPAFPD